MSLEDYMFGKEPDPEEIFTLLTVFPVRKIKVTAYLEDGDGDKVLVKEIAESLVKYVDEQMKQSESNPINSQMFPLCGQFLTSVVPRFVGLNTASLMFQAESFRYALLTLSLASTLFMQYIQQHNLKIVTETTELTDLELETYLKNSAEADQRVREAFRMASGSPEDEQQ